MSQYPYITNSDLTVTYPGQKNSTAAYTLPIASASDLGGIKVGANLAINPTTGVLDASTGNIVTSFPLASSLGVVSGGSVDQSAAINAILSTYAGVVFDFQPSSFVYVSGTINATNKVLKFVNGTYLSLTSSAVVNGGLIDAGYNQMIFSGSGLVKPQGMTSARFSAKWFGATGLGSAFDDAALQQAMDASIYNGVLPMIFPIGTYKLGKGILFRKDSGGQGFTTPSASSFLVGMDVYFEGGSYGPGSGVTFVNTNANSFTIGLQKVKGLRSNGCSMIGVNSLSYTQYQIQQDPSSTFTVNSSLDTAGAAHCGLGVDIFGTSAAPNKFPDFTSYYTETTNGGSTDIVWSNSWAEQFTVCYMFSPNGTTQNGEIIRLQDCWAGTCKAAVSTGNSQERTVMIDNFHCWGGAKYIFDCRNYGTGQGCPPQVNRLNLAGGNRYLCALNNNVSKGLIITDMHAELLYSLGGNFTTNGGALTIKDSWISLTGTSTGNGVMAPNGIFKGGSLRIENSLLFQFGSSYSTPLTINAMSGTFDGVTFSYVPINCFKTGVMTFRNCTSGGNPFGTGTMIGGSEPISARTDLFTDGMSSTTVDIGSSIIKTRTKSIGNNAAYLASDFGYYYRGFIGVPFASAITLSSISGDTAQFSLSSSSNDYKKLLVGDVLVFYGTDAYGFSPALLNFGLITALSGGTVSIGGIAQGMDTTTAWKCYVYRNEYMINTLIVGDTTSGSNIVSNVVAEGGSVAVTAKTPIYIPNFPLGTTIVSYNSGTQELTLSLNATITENQVAIISSEWKGEEYGSLPATGDPYGAGWKVGDIRWNTDTKNYPAVVYWLCTLSGISNSAKLPTFQAYP